jgi:pyruvate dehydrogenase E2 component (dihydrolipoamide acetyltransferase)
MAEFRMPSLGADMVQGRLIQWIKQPGDPVRRGDIIAEVDTDKGVIEVEVFTDGVLDRVLVQPGEKVPVGTVMATIREGGGAAPPVTHEPETKASPLARSIATALGVDLEQVRGTGPGGAITRRDVEVAARGATPAPIPVPRVPMPDRTRAMRQAIAAAMARSKRDIPHFYVSHDVDVGPVVEWLAERNQGRSARDRVLQGALFLKAVARALVDFPELNAWWQDGAAVPKPDIHLGVAIALRGGGLVAPALHHVGRLPVDDVSARLRELVTRARSGSLRSSEVADPTMTVTSLGDRGVDGVFGVIYPPQVAIVGFGSIRPRPWVLDHALVVRPVVTASVSADHRVTDGHRAALFLAAVAEHLRQPGAL